MKYRNVGIAEWFVIEGGGWFVIEGGRYEEIGIGIEGLGVIIVYCHFQ